MMKACKYFSRGFSVNTQNVKPILTNTLKRHKDISPVVSN